MMAEASIPVDLFNPGQVFACLGFLEAADTLLGEAEGGFDWSVENDVRFRLRAAGEENPFEAVLEFLANAEVRRYAPAGYSDPIRIMRKSAETEDTASVNEPLDVSETFPCAEADRMALPIRLVGSLRGRSHSLNNDHWTDGSNRNPFKLYSGNRSAAKIACAMLYGTREKVKKHQQVGDVKTQGVASLWNPRRKELIEAPFDMLAPIGGSYNFDPRGTWTGIDAGYSPNDQEHGVAASPVVEILAAMGLGNARPDEFGTRRVRYGAWGLPVPPLLARAALGAARAGIPFRVFQFSLALSGKNKVVTFAQEEPSA